MYKIMDGKLIKKQILEELKNKVSEMEEKPSLVVIQIGDNDASNVYIKQKAKMADYIGYGYRHIKLDENVSEEEALRFLFGSLRSGQVPAKDNGKMEYVLPKKMVVNMKNKKLLN